MSIYDDDAAAALHFWLQRTCAISYWSSAHWRHHSAARRTTNSDCRSRWEPEHKNRRHTPYDSSSYHENSVWSVDAACKSPVIKAADYASEPLPENPSKPPPPPSPPKSDSPTPSDLPVPMLPLEDPKNPQWWLGCGVFGFDPYFKQTFYQFGASFSKADAYNVIDRFCKENVQRKRVIGKVGNYSIDKPGLKALSYVEKSYDTPGGSGKLQVRIQVDTDNRNRQGATCPNDDVFSFEAGKSELLVHPLPMTMHSRL